MMYSISSGKLAFNRMDNVLIELTILKRIHTLTAGTGWFL